MPVAKMSPAEFMRARPGQGAVRGGETFDLNDPFARGAHVHRDELEQLKCRQNVTCKARRSSVRRVATARAAEPKRSRSMTCHL